MLQQLRQFKTTCNFRIKDIHYSLSSNFIENMKRITKDRSAHKLTSTRSNAESKSSSNRRKTTRNPQAAETTATVQETTEPIQTQCQNVSEVLSKYKTTTTRPKLLKRPHLKVESENSNDIKPDIKVEIKEEPEDSKADLVTVLQDYDLLPSPDKKCKYELEAQVHVLEMLENLRQMRKNFDAPVDSMGCDECRDKTSDPKDGRFQVLVSLILSAMTKDQVTYAAMQKLINYGCSVDKMLEISDEELAEMIRPVNYWKKKVQYIKEASKTLKEEYDGDIPATVEDLCKLKGVGPKIAHLCMKSAWGVLTGIGVDTHVHRISNRMGWVKSKTPEETRKQLEALLPQDSWMEVNKLLVGFGQQVCQQAKPQCATCLNNHLCPFGISYLLEKK